MKNLKMVNIKLVHILNDTNGERETKSIKNLSRYIIEIDGARYKMAWLENGDLYAETMESRSCVVNVKSNYGDVCIKDFAKKRKGRVVSKKKEGRKTKYKVRIPIN